MADSENEAVQPPQELVVDPERLAALDALAILDTPPEQGFDDVVRLAGRLCAAPVALVSLVAADRQWFKARVGFPSCETDLDRSVCRFALAEPDLLVVPDLTADPRTAANPLVTGELGIRFYAGAPLRSSDGQVVGSLCVIDTVPRPGGLTPEQADDLRALGRQVSNLLEMRRAVRDRDAILEGQRTELRQGRRLDLLSQASAALLVAADAGAVLEPILAAGAATLGFDQSFIYDLDPGGRHLRLVRSVGADEALRAALARVELDVPLCGIVVQTGQPLVLKSVQTSAEPRYALARGTGVDAYAGYPIVSRGQLVGVVSFASARARAFDAEALNFFATLARLMSGVRERRDAEAALRASDRRARLAQEAGGVGTFEVDVVSSLMNVSTEFAHLFGVPAAGLYSAERFETLVVPEDRALPSNEATRQAGSAALDVEYRIRRADDGRLRWIARRASFVRDAAGAVIQMFGTVGDVTERREAEAQLALSEERYRSLFNAVDAGFCIFEMRFDEATGQAVDYRFTEVNDAFTAQTGLTDVVGRWMRDLAPAHEQAWFDRYGEIACTGQPQRFEDEAAALGRFYEISAFRVGPPEAHQVGALFRDITERQRTERALQASEAVARENVERVQLALAAGAIIGTWHWDIPTDRFTVDEAFARSFGLDPALGREGIPLAQIVATVHPDDQEGLATAIGEAVARGGAYAYQYRVRRSDGRYYWIEANGRVDHAPDGTPLSFPGVLLDVEERRAAQERLRTSEAHWRGLFERLSEGFQLCEALRDATGKITDFRLVDVNPAYAAQIGVPVDQVVGRTALEVFGDAVAEWILAFGQVVETGQPWGFTRQFTPNGRWYDGSAFRLEGDRFGVIFLDVSARMQADERRAALMQLGDRLRDLTTTAEMTRAAAEIVGRTLGATRAAFGRVEGDIEFVEIEPDWCAPGQASVAGRHRYADFGDIRDDLRHGKALVVDDVAADPRTRGDADMWRGFGIAAFVHMPVRERGRTVAVFIVHDVRPRAWKPEELAFLRNVADRLEVGVARVRAEELQAVLNHELAHRLKNTLTIVQSIAGQTLRKVTEVEAVDAFTRRLLALSRAHDVLLNKSFQAAKMRAVMESVLTLQADLDRFALDGPDLEISPEAALSLSLLLHELATNAVKYGALSSTGGRVRVSWRADGDPAPELVLDWTEEGGPTVTPPGNRGGFGSKLIRRGLLGTQRAALRFEPVGLHAEFRVPLAEVQVRMH